MKRAAILDAITLAGLYTLRIIGGGAAEGVEVSKWLLAFSVFFFFSLGSIKRFAELKNLQKKSLSKAKGRDYQVEDLSFVASSGVASGYISVLVLALYINSDKVSSLYSVPEALWAILLLILYWISRIWLLAHRGEANEDPVIFTAKDAVSYIIAFLIAAIALGATLWR